ncbi:DUF4139 domain-containing protein [Epibacterium ulvae]|uniref:DUF4139 domain-containing protein n=1 Tax=Epibacterium ulvae TaxID=1156985 RepID=UPI00248F6309|nr:DUF4139 domain-containing protein [Epibacterium ulvae]
MMRLSILSSLCLGTFLSSTALAAQFEVPSLPTAATVFSDLARVTRKASIDLPAGTHQLRLTGLPLSTRLETLQVDLPSAKLLSATINTDEQTLLQEKSAALIAAEAEIQTIENQIAQVKAQAATARAEAVGAEATLQFLQQLGANDGLGGASAAQLQDIAAMIATQAQTATRTVVAAQETGREIEQQLPPLREALKQAKTRRDLVNREDRARTFLTVEVDVTEPGVQDVTLNYYTDEVVFWAPYYELHLSTGEAAQLEIKRGVQVLQDTGEDWHDVAITLSTASPTDQSAPSILPPQLRRIEEPRPAPIYKNSARADLQVLAEPLLEPSVIAESAPDWTPDRSGAVLQYELGHQASIATGEAFILDMDVLSTVVTQRAEAVPLYDDKAYRVVAFENTFDERLLGASEVPYFVDGDLVAIREFTALAAGETTEIGFGPIHGLTIARDVLRKNEGDRGVISRSNLEEQDVEITVENLTSEIWPMRLLDRVPYTEQEDLEISWTAEPRPDQENVDNRRGILAWEFDLAPKGQQQISLKTRLQWPEGMELR